MKVLLQLLFCGISLVLFLSSCENNTLSAIAPSPLDTLQRQISSALRATCQALPTGTSSRILRTQTDTGISTFLTKQDLVYSISFRIFDTTGSFVVSGISRITETLLGSDTIPSLPVQTGVLWDGKDAAGRSVPSGHYFLFERIADSTGANVRTDSSCLGIKRLVPN